MIKVNYAIKSQELKRILDSEINNQDKQKLFFKVMSKVSSLYNLTVQGHKAARVELFKIVSTIDKIKKDSKEDIEKFKSSLSQHDVALTTLRDIEINIGNPVNYAIFEILKVIDLIEEYDYLVFIKTGRKNKNSVFYKYIGEIRKLLARSYAIKIKDLMHSDISKKEVSFYEASKNYSIMPTIENKQTA
jgi:hypothetical protein